jgi:PAS domain S-box-containing protein
MKKLFKKISINNNNWEVYTLVFCISFFSCLSYFVLNFTIIKLFPLPKLLENYFYLVYLFILITSLLRYFYLSRIILIILISFGVLTAYLQFGPESNSRLLFMIPVGISTIIFNQSELKAKYTLIGINIFLLLITTLTEFRLNFVELPSHELVDKTQDIFTNIFLYSLLAYFILSNFFINKVNNDLDSTETKLSSIYQSENYGIVILDKEFRIIDFNQKYKENVKVIFNQTAEKGHDFFSYILPIHKTQITEYLNLALKGNKVDWIVENPENTLARYQLHFSPIYSKSKEVQSILILSFDISFAKQTENILQQYSQNFETAFESAHMMIWFFNSNGQITSLNNFALEYLNIPLKKEEFIGKRLDEVIKTNYTEQLQKKVFEILKSGKSELNDVEMIDEINCISSDRIVNYNSDGKIIGVSVYSRDITASKIAEDRLRLLTSVVLNTYDSIIITDNGANGKNQKIIFVNSAFTKITGYTLDDVFGKSPKILQGPNSDRISIANIQKSIQEKKPVKAELINYSKSGEEFWVDVSIVPVFNEEEVVTHWISTQRNITERKKIEKELVQSKDAAERANKYKSQFLANMSHEIRTPLNAILGFTEEILQMEVNPEKKSYLNLIYNSGDTLLKLLEDILDFSRIEQGKLTISPMEFNFKEFIDSSIAPYKLKANEISTTLTINLDEKIPKRIILDPFRLKQILINLITNALKFTSKGMIQIDVKYQEQQNKILEFIIADNGIGIPKEKLEEIFESFVQADDSITRKYGGSGLGLAICKNLVKLMGGELGVRSPSSVFNNMGTDFWFKIPIVYNEQVESLEINTSSKKNFWFADRIKVLIAEDNQTNQILINKILTKMNCETTLANNGEKALEFFTLNEYDIILMDIQMPIMDGYKATKLIRNLKDKKQIPIIAVSANVYKEEIENSKEAGMDAYVTKPFKQIELFETIDKLIKGNKE